MGTDHQRGRTDHVHPCHPLHPRRHCRISAPSWIIPEANTYGTQVIGTGQTQGSQTIQYGYDNALAGLNFLNSGLQSTNTFGASTATNGLTAATNTATFGSSVAPYGPQGLNYGLGLGQQYFWG